MAADGVKAIYAIGRPKAGGAKLEWEGKHAISKHRIQVAKRDDRYAMFEQSSKQRLQVTIGWFPNEDDAFQFLVIIAKEFVE